MMRRRNWIKCVVAASLCLTAISCSKESGSTPEKKFVDNFNALVMGGKTIDAHQDWNTVGNASVKISVDLGNDGDYTVYISQTPLIFDTNAVYIGMARLKSGESKTINIPRPANAALLYAACYDADGHAISKPFTVTDGTTEISFTGKSPSSTSEYTQTIGNDWSVPILNLPDLSAYTTGTLVDPLDTSVELNDENEVHFKVSSDFTGFIPSLGTFAKKSVYVTATWTLTFNQQVLRDNVLIVGEGGKIVIPEGFKLSSKPMASENSGLIYILPGGEITGDGTVEFATDSGVYSYNAGTITTKDISLYGCTFYNRGSVGTIYTNISYATNDNGTPSMLVNTGIASFSMMIGEDIAIQNAGSMRILDELVLSGSSKMDDGSYLECSALTLKGSSDGSKVLHMGNAAYIYCRNDLSVDNFGIHGPSGDKFSANAVLKINRCSYCATTDGVAGTYLLDHVELILPESFPTVLSNGALNVWDGDKRGIGIGKLQESFSGYYSLYMIYYWLNGYEGRPLSPDCYQWTLNDNKYCLTYNGASTIDASRQTCFYSTSPSYDYSGIGVFSKSATGSAPAGNNIFYLFETLEASTKDFDYDDVVLRVNIPVDNGDGTFTSSVQVMCVGNKVSTTINYNGAPFGEEVHAAIGTAVNTPVNTTQVNRVFRKLGELTFTSGDFRIDQLGFSLSVEESEGNVTEESQPSSLGSAPLYIVVNGNEAGKYFWPLEGVNIGLAYPQFSVWASNVQTAIDWYDSSNAASNKIVSY